METSGLSEVPRDAKEKDLKNLFGVFIIVKSGVLILKTFLSIFQWCVDKPRGNRLPSQH